MKNIVEETERLYRGIKRSRPDAMNGKKITSALFKQANGVSVDRDGDRKEENIILCFKERFDQRLKGLVMLNAKDCFDIDAFVVPKPTVNEYHAEIYDSLKEDELSSLKGLMLAEMCAVVYFDENVQWTY